jgi:AGCS family alanine or glycine:cation symporter
MHRRTMLVGVLSSVAALAGLLPSVAHAQEKTFDERVNETVSPVTDKIVEIVFYEVDVGGAGLPLIVVWLIAGAIFFTLYLGFINVRGFRQSLRIVRGDYHNEEDPGEVSHFTALTAALSGTVGLGNIAGVAVAITLGGPGATFWMILAGLLGMSTKFAECTLGVKYRRERTDGTVSGGPMYYLSRGIKEERGWGGVGRFLAIGFCVTTAIGSLGGGNMFQSNQAFSQFLSVTGGEGSFFDGRGWLFGLVVALIVGFVIIGGMRSIGRVTSRVVPFMAVLYLVCGVIVLGANAGQIPDAFGQIIEGAFSPEGVAGGFVGVLIQGFRRATFSNEAGIGSAAIAHSAVKTRDPVTEGYVALLEPFIDTVVICTMTALIIIVSGVLATDAEGVALTSAAYETVLPWFDIVLAVAVIMFAFSTMLAWSYYGSKAVGYLFGDSTAAELVFKAIFCLFIVIGATMELDAIIGFSDAMIFSMALFNIAGLYLLAPVVRRELRSYERRLGTGEIETAKQREDGATVAPADPPAVTRR